MKKIILNLPLVLGMVAFLWACKVDGDEPLSQIQEKVAKTVSFSVPQAAVSSGRTNATSDPKSILVTIVDKDNHEVVTRKELSVYKVGTQYISVPLVLEVPAGARDFKIRDFMVVNQGGEIMYITPRAGSKKAHLVAHPVDISFTLLQDQELLLEPEVVVVEETSTPAEFGYTQFQFKLIESLKVKFIGYVVGGNGVPALSEMDLKITGTFAGGGAPWVYQTTLEGVEDILLKKAQSYKVTASKAGHITWERTMAIANNATVEITLQRPANDPPTVHEIFPLQAHPGQIIKLRGTNLGSSIQDIQFINIGPYHAVPVRWISSQEVEITFNGLPPGAPQPPADVFPITGIVNGVFFVSMPLFKVLPVPASSGN